MKYIVLAVISLILACSNSEAPQKTKGVVPSTKSEMITSKSTERSIPVSARQGDTIRGTDLLPSQVAENPKAARSIPQLSTMTSASFADEVKGMARCSGETEADLKQCDVYHRILKILSDREASSTHRRFLRTSAGNRLLADPSPNVRWLAVRLLRSIAQVESSSREKLSVQLTKETSPLVLESLVRTLGFFVAEDTALKGQYIELAGHPSDLVRAASLRWLAHLNDPADTALAALLESKLKSDESKAVGKAICVELALRPNERGLPPLLKVVRSAEHRANDPCFLALTSM